MKITRGLNGAAVVVVVLLALANGTYEGRTRSIHPIYHNGGSLLPPSAMEQHMMRQAYDFCKSKLMDREERIKYFDIYSLKDVTDAFKSLLLSKRSVEEAMEALPPLIKRLFMDCLREVNPQSPISLPMDAKSKSWLLKNMDFLHSSWKSFVRHQPSQPGELENGRSVHSAAPAPSPSPNDPSKHSPASALSPKNPSGPSLAPAPYRDLAPSSTLSPSPVLTASSNPSKMVELPHKPPVNSHLPEKPRAVHHQPPAHHPTVKEETDNIWTIIAVPVAVTAAASFLFVALIFCVLNRKRKFQDAHRHVGPPQKLCPSGHSTSFSTKSHGNGNDPSSINNLPAISENHDPTLVMVSMEVDAATAVPPLKPSPSKAVPPPPGPPPPPPPKLPAPPLPKMAQPPPVPPGMPSHSQSKSARGNRDYSNGDSEAPKAKLKPFFWDKVMASPDHEMVWHEIKSGSFQFNEEMMESLFSCAANKNRGNVKKDITENVVQYIQIIDPKKAQNLSIVLKALNVTAEDVCDALDKGTKLPMELLQTLLRMVPTSQEELKLRLFTGDLSRLGPAERFLKVIIDIPFAFKRFEALQFMGIAEEEVSSVKYSLQTLEVACDQLKNNRLFLKLLEAVLKTGNRMNDGTYRGGALAFKLDTLLKLSDVRGTDGKTTLLHFVIQEIIRYEGIRALRIARESQSISSLQSYESVLEESIPESTEHLCTLGIQEVSGLSTELEDVKKAAAIDAESIAVSVAKLENSLVKARELLNTEMTNVEEDSKFSSSLSCFVEQMEEEVKWISKEEKRITALVESTADYFHGNAGKSEGLRLFIIVRDFLLMLDRVCAEVRDSGMHMGMSPKKQKLAVVSEPPSQDKILHHH